MTSQRPIVPFGKLVVHCVIKIWMLPEKKSFHNMYCLCVQDGENNGIYSFANGLTSSTYPPHLIKHHSLLPFPSLFIIQDSKSA